MNFKIILIRIFLFLIVLFIAAYYIPFLINASHIRRGWELNINQKQHEIDSLKKLNAILDSRNDSLKHEFDSIMKNIKTGKDRIIYLTDKKNEKIQSIDNYTNNQMYKFFSDINITAEDSIR